MIMSVPTTKVVTCPQLDSDRPARVDVTRAVAMAQAPRPANVLVAAGLSAGAIYTHKVLVVTTARGTQKMLISIIVFDDFSDLDVFLMWDLLNRVKSKTWKVGMIGDRAEQRSRTDVTVSMHAGLGLAAKSNAVLFAGGPGARIKLTDQAFLRAIRLDPERQLIGSVCAGTLLLAALGLLEHKRVAAHPEDRDVLERYAVRAVDEPFVSDGNLATAAGCLAAQQLAGWAVERLSGQDERDRIFESIQPFGRASKRETHALRRVDW
jgi:transcriptional regulator GlxA family with amidase domain